MNYNNLYNFVTIVECKTMTKAAEELYISQPALSIHLKELEQELGVPLFLRTKRGLKLTEAGDILYSWAAPFFGQEKAVLKKITDKKMHLTIGIMGVDFLYQLPLIIDAFKKENPNIHVQVKRMNWEPLIQNLQNQNIDISFQITEDKIPGFCNSLILETGETGIAVAASSPLAQHDVIHARDLKNYPFVLVSRKQEPFLYTETLEFCRDAGFEPNIIGEYEFIEPMLSMVNMGEAITTTSTLSPFRHFDHIRYIKVEGSKTVHLSMLWHKEATNPAAACFIDYIKDSYS